jgi:predicted component of viral defense system (DUF524 family)
MGGQDRVKISCTECHRTKFGDNLLKNVPPEYRLEEEDELNDLEQRILKTLQEERRLTFKELSNQDEFSEVSVRELENAVRHLLHSQYLAETGDWNYYVTEVPA